MDTITSSTPRAIADCNVVISAINGSPCHNQFHRLDGQRNVSCGDVYCDEGTLANGYGPIDDVRAFVTYTARPGTPDNPALQALQSIVAQATAGNLELCSSQYMVSTIARKLAEFVDEVDGVTRRRYTNTAIKTTLVALKAVRVASAGIGVSNEESEARVPQVLNLLPRNLTIPAPGKREADVDYEDQRVLAAALEVAPVLLVTADIKLLNAVTDHLGRHNILGLSTGYYAKRARRAG